MKRKYRRLLFSVLALDILLIGWLSIQSVSSQIPDTMWTYIGKEEELFSGLPAKAEKKDSVEALNLTGDSGETTLKSQAKGNYSVDIRLFGLFHLKTVEVKVMDPMHLAPSGEPIGIYVETNGLLVLATTSVEGKDGLVYEPAANIIQKGDYILKMNGKPVKTIKEFNATVQRNKGEKIRIRIRRNGRETDVALKPVQVRDGSCKLGIWVREDTQGIGTMTYVTKNGGFGALGHGITDADTGTLMNLGGGELFNTEILDITQGKRGTPGELEGYINMVADNCIGLIKKNTNLGIFGQLSEDYRDWKKLDFMPVGLKQDVKKSKAWIISDVEGNRKRYEIEIEEININSKDNKGMVIRVTDSNLLKITGGIVQGMSGSPVIQDGKIIGAVTHVLVDDPTRGYAAFIENMLSQ